ncbi:MAG: AAA family ATPase [Bacteroides sp.]|nr:AAA family ATPase [Bacteroides sp.]
MFLSKLHIVNYRGIKDLTLHLDTKLNVLIGPNGRNKTAIIDAIRLFYSKGTQQPLYVTQDDFHIEIKDGKPIQSEEIIITYDFDDLSEEQEGLFYQYLIMEDNRLHARVTLRYTLDLKERVRTEFYTGKESGQRADPETLNFFVSYYLGALRDSTKDLLSPWDNKLGAVINRKIKKAKSDSTYVGILKEANARLLTQEEVSSTKELVNTNLNRLNQGFNLGLQIEDRKVERIVGLIKPFLPHAGGTEGFPLYQNSLGYNNVLYVATVLSDLEECHRDEKNYHYILLIEEPEAHLHPQLQVNLYNFLIKADSQNNCQIFITSHSPTLTSKVPFENLIIINEGAVKVSDIFKHHENYYGDLDLKVSEIIGFRYMLQRYLDVTRSQLFFSNGCVLVEGVSEALLLECFARKLGKSLTERQIEIVNMEGTAFYQFLLLFNSKEETLRLPFKIAVVTDGDQYPASKDFSLKKLIDENLIEKLREEIKKSSECSRIPKLRKLSTNESIGIFVGQKTFEYELCRANVCNTIDETIENSFFKFLQRISCDDMKKVITHLRSSFTSGTLSDDDKMDVAILMWKACPGKSEMAQTLAYEFDKLTDFVIPNYLREAINHFVD